MARPPINCARDISSGFVVALWCADGPAELVCEKLVVSARAGVGFAVSFDSASS